MNAIEFNLGRHADIAESRLEMWRKEGFAGRLLARDHSIWSNDPDEITNRLGWLGLPETSRGQVGPILDFAEEVRSAGFRRVVLLGMGGSSTAPAVFREIFGSREGFPQLDVLDTTHPDAIAALAGRLDIAETLFIVASKSGTTLEPLSLFKYFWGMAGNEGASAGGHFVAITDPGTALEELARRRDFLRTFLAVPDLGGRYSALTAYGLVPAALIGVDVAGILDRARVEAMELTAPAEGLPSSLKLGAALGELARIGMDKLTFVCTPSIAAFPLWLEQLVAESTGKDGKGIIPVVGEAVAGPSSYGRDRVFIYLHLEGDESREMAIRTMEDAGHPTVRVRLADACGIGAEIFRWEVAVAAAASVLGIHPFNQPDVELSKWLAREAMGGAGTAVMDAATIRADSPALKDSLDRWLAEAKEGSYVALQPYLQETPGIDALLSGIRQSLMERSALATTSGYGPRFLHSTGQLHKGGPNKGLFLQLIDEPSNLLVVPGQDYSFNDIIRAQSAGDYSALTQRGREVLRIHLGNDPERGLTKVHSAARA